MSATKPAGKAARPLSPHLQVYRFAWTMTMSIVHRITGAGLYFGTALLAIWLIAAASGPEAYARTMWLYGSWFGQLVLVGFTWALIHHMLGGVRHLVWDTGRNFEPKAAERMAILSLAGSLGLTALIWLLVLVAR